MKPLLVTLVLAALAVAGVTLLTGDANDTRPSTTGTATVPLRSVPASRLTAAQINRQDRPNARRQRDEARSFDRRPLLNALPTTLEGVTFDIGGLASNGRTTIIRAHPRELGRRRARIAYDTLKRRVGDRSRSYRLVIEP
jgi:hypothetical protein